MTQHGEHMTPTVHACPGRPAVRLPARVGVCLLACVRLRRPDSRSMYNCAEAKHLNVALLQQQVHVS